jgi:hypothetical protein
MTPQTPPTDRPLTAGDVPLLREGDVLDVRSYGNEMKRAVLIRASAGDCLRVHEEGQAGPNVWGIHRFSFVSRPATSAASEGEGVNALVKELRLAACGLFELKNDRGDYGYFDTIADRLAALASPPVSERERELEGLVREFLRMSVGIYGHPKDEDYGLGLIHARARALTAQPAGEGK